IISSKFGHNYHLNRGPPRCVFKIDIQKAYDMVSWKFLEDILMGFCIHEMMIKWIMACVSSTSFSISVNGDLHGYFQGKRRLRQDDLIMFSRGDIQSATILMEALKEFKGVSSLVPTSVWFDTWDTKCPLMSILTTRAIHNARLSIHAKVADLISNNAWSWPAEWNIKFPILFNLKVPILNDQEDLVMRPRLKTQDPLRPWDVWSRAVLKAEIPIVSPSRSDIMQWILPIAKKNNAIRLVGRLIVGASSYYICQERNNRLHSNCSRSVKQLVNVILDILLGSDNYSSWMRSMTIALNAKNKFKIITKEYDSHLPLRALWERNYDMIISWILNTGYWDEIDALEAPYMCICNYTCENGMLNGARESRKRLIQFLMGLDESFANIRGQILLMQPLPTTTKAYGMLRQEEKQRESLTPKHVAPIVMSSFTNSNNNHSPQPNFRQNRTFSESENHRNDSNTRRSTFKQGVIYGNCQKEGHYKSECYQLVGYPVGRPFHGKVRPSNNNRTSISRPRAINITVGFDVASPSTRETHDDATVFAKMDNLQNQLNQVMLMLQNSQGVCDPKAFAAGKQQEDSPWDLV
ncbi:cysteine-rich receptor-like protein kinase 8, partial [Tanacetum coccineum]